MYTAESLKRYIASIKVNLGRQEQIPKVRLQLKLLESMDLLLGNPQGKSIVSAINCMEHGGDLPYRVLLPLVKLLEEASCGHFSALFLLNFLSTKISFFQFIDILTRGKEKAGSSLLTCNRSNFTDLLPKYKKLPDMLCEMKINNKTFIKLMSSKENGLYSLRGVDKNNIPHRFVIAKNDSCFYYADINEEGLFDPKFPALYFPQFYYSELEYHLIAPLNEVISTRLMQRMVLLRPNQSVISLTLHGSTTQESKSETPEVSKTPEVVPTKPKFSHNHTCQIL